MLIQGDDDNEDTGPAWSDRDYTYDEVNIQRINTTEHSVIMKNLICKASCSYSLPDTYLCNTSATNLLPLISLEVLL